jgi:hypothetical protein
MTTLIKDLIDIPERVQRTDFVLNLTYGLAPEAVPASGLLRSTGADQRRSPLAGDLTGEPSSAGTREQLARRRLVSRCPA